MSGVCVKLGEREGSIDSVSVPVGIEPGICLGDREWRELDVGQAPARAPGRGVKPFDGFIGRDQDQGPGSVAEQAVGDIEQTGESLARNRARIGGDQLAGVLQDHQPPFVLVVSVPREDVEQVLATAPEQLLRVKDEVRRAPRRPGADERPQRM